jgi:hypothetical protein
MTLNHQNINRVFEKSKLQDKNSNKLKFIEQADVEKGKSYAFKMLPKSSHQNIGRELRINTLIEATDYKNESSDGY